MGRKRRRTSGKPAEDSANSASKVSKSKSANKGAKQQQQQQQISQLATVEPANSPSPLAINPVTSSRSASLGSAAINGCLPKSTRKSSRITYKSKNKKNKAKSADIPSPPLGSKGPSNDKNDNSPKPVAHKFFIVEAARDDSEFDGTFNPEHADKQVGDTKGKRYFAIKDSDEEDSDNRYDELDSLIDNNDYGGSEVEADTAPKHGRGRRARGKREYHTSMDSDDMPLSKATLPRNRRRGKDDVADTREDSGQASGRLQLRSGARRPSNLHSSSDEDKASDEDVLRTPLSAVRRGLTKRISVIDESEDEQDDTNPKAADSGSDNDNSDDINEYLDPAVLTPSRLRSRPRGSRYREILEASRLKALQQGTSSQFTNGSASNDGSQLLADDIEDSVTNNLDDGEEDVGLLSFGLFEDHGGKAMEGGAATNSDSDKDDDDIADFIVSDNDEQEENNHEEEEEDSEAVVDSEVNNAQEENHHHHHKLRKRNNHRAVDMYHNLKDLSEIPEEFNLAYARDLRTSFHIYAQFLVHCHTNLGSVPLMDAATRRYFEKARDALEHRIQSVKDSIVGSSAWHEHFTKDLKKYPELETLPIDDMSGCEACHFADKRTANMKIRLYGSEYDPKTLTPIRDSRVGEESDEAGENDIISQDEKEGVTYKVGRFCKMRGMIYHQLHHYRYHLNQQVGAELAFLGWPRKRFMKLEGKQAHIAESLLQAMERDGGVTRLYDQMIRLLDNAQDIYLNKSSMKGHKFGLA